MNGAQGRRSSLPGVDRLKKRAESVPGDPSKRWCGKRGSLWGHRVAAPRAPRSPHAPSPIELSRDALAAASWLESSPCKVVVGMTTTTGLLKAISPTTLFAEYAGGGSIDGYNDLDGICKVLGARLDPDYRVTRGVVTLAQDGVGRAPIDTVAFHDDDDQEIAHIDRVISGTSSGQSSPGSGTAMIITEGSPRRDNFPHRARGRRPHHRTGRAARRMLRWPPGPYRARGTSAIRGLVLAPSEGARGRAGRGSPELNPRRDPRGGRGSL